MNARVRKVRRSADEVDSFVLDVIERSKGPVSAYSIVGSSKILDEALLPSQVYRSLNRLLERRRVQRIATLNAYVATCFRQSAHLLCSGCGSYQAEDGVIVQEQLAEICKTQASNVE